MTARPTFTAFRSFAVALALSLLWIAGARAKPIEIKTTLVPLNPEVPGQRRVGKLIFRGAIELTSANKHFGGLSGLLVDPQALGMLAVTDKGYWLRAQLQYDAGGNLSGLTKARLERLRDLEDKPLSGKSNSDSEAIQPARDGVLVSFERDHRIWRYRAPGNLPNGPAEPVSLPPDVASAPGNGGLEAICEFADGRLLIMTEAWYDENHDLRGWLRQAGQWSAVSYAVTEDFAPTDFSLLPSGDLLVLERRYKLLSGPAVRLQVIAGDTIRPGARLEGRELAQFRLPLTVDNMEGVSAVEKPDGTYLYLVSDDNFSALQRTLLMMFKIAGD